MKKEGLEPKVLTQTCKDQWKAFSKEDKAVRCTLLVWKETTSLITHAQPFIDAAEKAKAKYEEALARYEAGNKDVAAPDIDVQDLLDQVKPALVRHRFLHWRAPRFDTRIAWRRQLWYDGCRYRCRQAGYGRLRLRRRERFER